MVISCYGYSKYRRNNLISKKDGKNREIAKLRNEETGYEAGVGPVSRSIIRSFVIFRLFL